VLTPLHDHRRYLCPGDPAPISRSVHLARLAASYPKCRSCAHGSETRPCEISVVAGPLIVSPSAGLQGTDHGFRGRAGEPLDRRLAMHWAGAFASLLWDDSFIWEMSAPDTSAAVASALAQIETLAQSARRSPVVVIGYDERPGSPEVLTGIARGLERMSCQVHDIGLTTEPCLRFGIDAVRADAGLFVTGSGFDPSWVGFDAFRQLGLPPEPAFLERWQARVQTSITRPSRSPGGLCGGSVAERYEAAMSQRFHALRPLTVVCGATSRQLLSRLERVFARLPCRVYLESLPTRRRNLSDAEDVDLLRVGSAVRQHDAHLGIVIAEDSSACGFVDETGRVVDQTNLQARLIQHLLGDDPAGTIVLDTNVWDQLAPVVTSAGGRPVLVASADRAARLLADNALAACGGDHRLWLRGTAPVCDAIVTLAAVLQLLSRSDAEFSRVLSND